MIRLSSLGDALFALAAVESIRRAQPHASLAFLVEDRFAEVVRAHPAVDEVIEVPRRQGLAAMWKNLRALRARKFDCVLDLQGNAKSAAHLAALRGMQKIGFASGAGREGNHLFLTNKISPPPDAVHRVDRFLALLPTIGIVAKRVEPMPLRLPEGARERAREILAQAGDMPKVIMHPGTSTFGLFKRWEPERFGRLSKQLAMIPGAATFVTCGPGEELLAEAAAEAACGGALALPPSRDLLELTALLAEADAVVAGDTGPLHLANRMGTPVVALFGPKDPARYGPVYEPFAVVRREDVPCSPCSRRWCEAPACMAGITIEQAAYATRKMLNIRKSPAPANL